MQVRLWLAGVSFAACVSLVSGSAALLGEKDQLEAVKKIVTEIEKGNAAGASAAAKDGAKKFDETADLMHLFRPRNKGGLGWGPTAGKNPATDGLEKKIQEYAKGVPDTVAKDDKNNIAAARWIAALAELTHAKTPTKDASGGKTKKAWADWSKDLREASDAFAKASAAKNAKEMQKAAAKINTTCVNCHSKFKE
jgi:hypothetical protein